MVSDSDEFIAHQAKTDQFAFEKLIEKYNPAILRYCCRLLNFNFIEAEDAASETWMKAFQNINNFNEKLKFTSWLYRIAHNQCVDMIRKNSKKFLLVDVEILESVSIDFDQSITLKQDLELILKRLKPEDREILTLFYLQELSIQEISDILRIKPQAVSVKLFRAKDRAKQNVILNNPKKF